MVRTRIATAVIVTRGDDDDLEVLLVQRSPELRFFGGFHAFPGGVIDPADHDSEADRDDDEAHRRCALRELYEEVGYWPAALGPVDETLRRGLLERDSAKACRDFRARSDAAPALLADLRAIARLTTPRFAPVLYRTLFLHLAAPESFEPRIVPGELVAGGFVRPREVLERWRRGELLVAPPVLFMIEHLAELGLARFTEEMPAIAKGLEDGKLHPIRNVPGVIMAPLDTNTLPPATTTNAYIVGTSRLYVVDPAPDDPGEFQRLFDLLDELVDRGADVVGILLTHHHHDHVGAAEQTSHRYDAPVLASRETFDLLDARPGGALQVENSRILQDGTRLPLGVAPDGSPNWTLTVHHTPGHAPGHLAFRESRYGAVIAGDLVSTVSTIVIDPPEGHLATYLASLEAMRGLMGGAGVLHPAHGPVASDGTRLLERYLVHRQRREDALVAALDDGVETVPELVVRVYADVHERMHGVAARTLIAGLEKLEEEGRAVRRPDGIWHSVNDATSGTSSASSP